MTTIPQIVGRFRNSEYSDRVTILFNGTTPVPMMTEEELWEHINYQIKQAHGTSKYFKQFKDEDDGRELARVVVEGVRTNKYLYIEGASVGLEDIDEIQYSEGMDLQPYEDAKLLDLEEWELVRTNLYINGKKN